VLIYVLGLNYAGLSTLFSSVLQILNLAELGIGTAVVYCMYKPMAEGNKPILCALFRFIRKFYYFVGCAVLIIGIILTPLLHFFVKGDIPDDLNIYVLYGLYLLNIVIGYFFFSYKEVLLNADQKVGILSLINSVTTLLLCILQIIVLLVWKNYYLFVIIMSFTTLMKNFIVSFVVKKQYPDIICSGSLPEDMKYSVYQRMKGLFVTRICNATRQAFNSVYISSLIGLSAVAIYGNYYYVMAAAISLLTVFTTAITAGVGNSIVKESVKKNYLDMRKLNFIFNWTVGLLTCLLLTSFQSLMTLWLDKDSLFPFSIVVILCVYFYSLNMGSIRAVYHDAAGLWWEARYRAILEAIANLIFCFILTKWIGVFGTILGALIALLIINYGYGTLIVFQYYFKGISPFEYYKDNLYYSLATLLGCAMCIYILKFVVIDGIILTLLINGMITVIVFNLVYYTLFCRSSIFGQSKIIVMNFVKRS